MLKLFNCRPGVRTLLRAVALLVVPFPGSVATGVNVAFIPGDAFFHSRLTQRVAESALEDDSAIALSYSYPDGSMTFGGYAGFSELEIMQPSAKMRARIAQLYQHLRTHIPKVIQVATDSDGNRTEVELNGFHFFVYNQDVDWNRQSIGLKHNEHWMDLPAEAYDSKTRRIGFAATAAHRYVPLLVEVDAVIDDWKFAKN